MKDSILNSAVILSALASLAFFAFNAGSAPEPTLADAKAPRTIEKTVLVAKRSGSEPMLAVADAD